MKRIGILGGTFNPVHIGHLALAEFACQSLELEMVIFVPACFPPHKSARGVIDAKHRLKMLELAIAGNNDFTTSDFEIRRGGKSYTIDTVRFLYGQYPQGTKFFFIMGEDNYAGLETWKDVEELAGLVEFVVVNRPQSPEVHSRIKVRDLRMPGLDVSSSNIRKNIARHRPVRYLLPEQVVEYIKRHHLYQKDK